jgi:hypothetical protein
MLYLPYLSPEAQALVRSGRHAYRPSEEDRERVLVALRGRLRDPVALGVAASRSFAVSARAAARRVLQSCS